MADKEKKNLTKSSASHTPDEIALMIEGLYGELSNDIANETELFVDEVKANADEKTEVILNEIKYGFRQNQIIYEDVSKAANEVSAKADRLEKIDEEISALDKKISFLPQTQEDYDAVAELVKEKVLGSLPYPEEVDYDKISDIVGEKSQACVSIHNKEVLDAIAGIPVAENVDYTRIVEDTSDRVIEKLADWLNASGLDLIATAVAEKIGSGKVEKQIVVVKDEEKKKPAPVKEEVAVATEPEQKEELVTRYKKSFEAKLCQSEDAVKSYYSAIKNELKSYKKLNSTLSWKGDRFNYGRDTIAKMAVNGKTLCVYFKLDVADPELKDTVYHQKDASDQKAYEDTPFMVKVKSDLAAKKAIRLVNILAEKLGAVKVNDYKPENFAKDFKYASTKKLIETGKIKVMQGKKIEFKF